MAAASMATLFPASYAVAGSPIDPYGNVGATNYKTMPFESTVFQPSWGAANGLTPLELFYEVNPQSFYLNPTDIYAAKNAAAGLTAQNIVPVGGAQRWEDTYAASFATPFPGEPSFVTADRIAGQYPSQPEFVAWRNWISANPQYWDLGADGGTMPANYRSWGGQWGHISPQTPLNAADCPPDMTSCTFGDSFAYRWGLVAKQTGAYGLILADFSDCEPDSPSNYQNFNSRVTAAFAAKYGYTGLPAKTVAEQAKWIVAYQFNNWNDFLGTGYANYFKALADRIGTYTGMGALILGSGDNSPAYRRQAGTDGRLIAQVVGSKYYMSHWDDQEIQAGRSGPILAPPNQELGGFVLAAAREPLLRNGAILEADDAAYWQAIASFYPTLSASAQQEVGYKLLKRLWTWASWAHIADRSGAVRRALAFVSRDYWDAGTLTALNPLQSLLQEIYPKQPFGPAIYYSVPAERIYEQDSAAKTGVDALGSTYFPQSVLQQFLDGGGVAGYYVSDAALPEIVKGSVNAPSAWVVLDASGKLSASESASLAATAPVVTSISALQALPNQPIVLSKGLSGFGFISNFSQVVLVLTNPSTQPNAVTLNGTVTLNNLPFANGTHKLKNLLTSVDQPITITNGTATIPVQLTRWDTLIYQIST